MPLFFLFLTTAFVLIAVGLIASNRLLWYDEFYTFYVAQLSSPIEIVQALHESVDNNPPLDYFLRYYAMGWFGATPFVFRLPSLILLLLGSLFLYRYFSSNGYRLSALIAFCFPILTIAIIYAHEGRAYMLLFASSAASLFFWKRCVESERKILYYICLYISLTIAPYSHLYGTFNYLPIFVGETTRLWRKKKFDYRTYLVLFLSCLSLVFLYPFVANATKFRAHFWTELGLHTPFAYYEPLLHGVLYLSAAAIVIVVPLLFLRVGSQSESSFESEDRIPIHGIAAAVTLCLTPFIQYIVAVTITKAFTPRYAIITVVGFAILFAYGCQVLERKKPVLCWAMAICVLLSSWFYLAKTTKPYLDKPSAESAEFISFVETADLPVVISHAHSYLFHDFYLPDKLRNKIYYLLGEDENVRYLGYDTDEIGLIHLVKIRDIHLADYKKFHLAHKEYYVVVRNLEDGWLIRKMEDGFKQGLINIELSYISPKLKIVKIRYR